MNKDEYRGFLHNLCSECDCHGNSSYCILVEFMISSKPDPRMLTQIKCVEKLKYDRHLDISWSGAFQIWVDEGYAKKFAEVYTENIDFQTMYDQLVY